jgi:hypothetical protein
MKKQDVGMNLRSHSLDKLRQIVTTGALLVGSATFFRNWGSLLARGGRRRRPPPAAGPHRPAMAAYNMMVG